jgi:hypothetical protein
MAALQYSQLVLEKRFLRGNPLKLRSSDRLNGVKRFLRGNPLKLRSSDRLNGVKRFLRATPSNSAPQTGSQRGA